MNPWTSLLEGLESVLGFFEQLVEPVAGVYAWGWAIVLLTFAARLVLLPLTIKQTQSMRKMQQLQPELKKVQEKYKADRSLAKTNPEKYRDLKAKQQQAQMDLYKEHGANPAGSCLPLVLQMPIFIALFNVLRGSDALRQAGFYGISSLGGLPRSVGIGGFALMVLMGLTTYLSQKQMMASNPSSLQNQQQKMLLYIMPFMLVFFSLNLPVGVLLYWVTTNVWTLGQQFIMFRNVEPAVPFKAAAPPQQRAPAPARDKMPANNTARAGARKNGSRGGKNSQRHVKSSGGPSGEPKQRNRR